MSKKNVKRLLAVLLCMVLVGNNIMFTDIFVNAAEIEKLDMTTDDNNSEEGLVDVTGGNLSLDVTEDGGSQEEDINVVNGEGGFTDAEERLTLMTSEDDIASGTYRDLVWVVDANRKLTVKGEWDIDSGPETYYLPWNSYKTSIVSAEFIVTGFTDVNSLFDGYSNLKNLDLSAFDTSKVTNMNSMFKGCYSLSSLDVSNFDTSEVTSMNSMFYGCSSLSSLDVNNFDTSKVTSMKFMFCGCSKLSRLNLSNFNTSNVTDMICMFYKCSSLTSLEIKNFDTGKVTDMEGMFQDCQNLISLDVSSFDTENVVDMGHMFSGCSSLTSLDVSKFDTGKVAVMWRMFEDCGSLTSLDVSNFDTSNVITMSDMFQNCGSLTSLDVSNFDTGEVVDMGRMFYWCNSLTSLDVSKFDTSKVTDMGYTFYWCNSLTSLDVSRFDTSKVTDMGAMFSDCGSLISLDVSKFNTSNVTNMSNMFNRCSSLTSLDVSKFDTSNVTTMSAMFSDCSSLTSLDVSKFNTSNVTNMTSMFNSCSSLTSLSVSNFDTSDVTNMSFMFRGCNSLTSLDVCNFDTSDVTDMSHMFNGCSDLSGLDLSHFDTSKVTDMRDVFFGCNSLTTIYTPCNVSCTGSLPTADSTDKWYCSNGTAVTELPPNLSYSVALGKNYIPEEKVPENAIIELKDGESAILVYDEATQLPIVGATVTIDGISYPTDSEGVARFTVSDELEKKQITVNASDYNEAVTYQYIKNKSLIRIGLELSDGTLQIISASVSLGNEHYDVLREKLVLGYAEDFDDFSSVTKSMLSLTIKSNKNNAHYEVLSSSNYIPEDEDPLGSDAKVLFTSDDGIFSVDVATEIVKVGDIEIARTAVTNQIEPGKKIVVRVTDEDGNSVVKMLSISSTYNYLTQENASQKGNFKLGDELRVSVPDDVPFIGGNDYVFGFEDDMPIEIEIDEDGKIKISYNKPADIDMDKFSKKYKDLEKKAGRVARLNSNIAGTKKFSAGMIDVSGKVCGYGEGNISEIMNGNPDIKLGIMGEIEGEAGYKHYWIIGVVPVNVFVEGKATGGVTFEAEMKFENWKMKEFDISGGSFNVTIQLEVGGGIGFGYEIEASLTGKANYINKPARKYEKLWLEASGKVKRVILNTWEKPLWESDTYEYTLYQKGTDTPQPFSRALMQNIDSKGEFSELSLMGRTYLNYTDGYNTLADTMGIVKYDHQTENVNSIVKAAVLPSASPSLIETDKGIYLFWIDDIASRDEYNRTAIVYAKSMDGINWSTPKQVIAESEDNTLDGAYDVFVDGEKIYLMWQDATRQLTGEDDILDVLKSLSVRYAVLDIENNTVTDNGCITQDSGYYMYPCTVAAGDEVYFAYVHNMLDTDDLDGNNRQHLYVMEKDSTAREVVIPDNAQIVNMDAGIFEGRKSLVCELDTDGDASTDDDREIYIYDFQADNLTRVTNNGIIDTMPVIADSGNIYWFQNTDIVQLSEKEKAPKSIWNGQQIAYQTVFTVATDATGKDTILWESVDKDAEDGSVAIYQTSENSDGTWGNVVKFAETTGTISSRISAAGSGDNLQVAHTEGIYLEDGTALKDLCVTTRENVTDIVVEYVDFDEESAAAGNSLVLRTKIVNSGNTTVDEVTVSVNDTVITTLTGLNLKPAEGREFEISGFSVPSTLTKSTYFTLKLATSGEQNQEDNTADFLLGCPDVYVEADYRIAGERTWLDVSILNNTTFNASGELLVHKSTEDGEVIYRKTYKGLNADNGYAYSVDLGNYEDKNVKYYVEVIADNDENSLGNNTEFVYIGYGTGIEDAGGNQEAQEVNAISFDINTLSLDIGDTFRLIAKDDKENTLEKGELLWSSSDNRIASVDQTGLIKAHRLGRVEITAYYGELSYSCSVTVGKESEVQTLTVWFDTQGGQDIAPITGIEPGSTITLPTDVRKPGYIFDGWFTQPINGEKIDGSKLLVEYSITLYAHWISGQSETGLWVEEIADQIYTGKAIKPQVKVYDGTTLLREKTDYTVSYKNNSKANAASNTKNTPTVIVIGKGNYSGKETVTFRILPIDINDSSVTTSDITVDYNNKLQKKVPTLAYNGKKLSNKKDFTVSYPALEQGVSDAYQAVGTYDILLTAKEGGNFTGTRTVKLTITDSILISKAKVSKIPDQPYTGYAIEPGLTVTYNNTTLELGTDYTVTYANNTEVGTATAILTGIGAYAGTKKVTFKITGTSIKKAVVTGIENKVYNGSEQKPDITVTLNNDVLTEGSDYELAYAGGQNVGKASVTIKGINAYTGTIKKSFKIIAYDLQANTENQISGLANDITVKYVKGGSKPEVGLTFAGKKLTEGTDYKVSYRNNKAVTTGETQKLPTLTIKGKGNFKGTLSKTFTITNKALDDADSPVTLSVADKVFVDQAGKYISNPILTDSDGKKLIAGKDYEKEISYSLEDGTPLTGESIVNVGSNVKVRVTGKGAYYGELEKIYRITEFDFSKAKIKIAPKVYTGSPITLDKTDISVTIGEDTLIYGTDYEVIEGSYTNNKNKGSAKVTIIGKGKYGGMKTSKFKITTKGFLWFWRKF